ncbi:MAG TPA: glycosyltransferase [Pyrinomonadaceae bacterium]
MKNPKRIFVLTLSFGAGHVRAAQAIAAEFQRQIPDAELQLIDALENCSFLFRIFYVWTYWAMIRCAPHIWDKFFATRIQKQHEQTAPIWAWRKGCRRVFDDIKRFKPDLIVACEVGACEIAVIAKRERLTSAEIVNVITDFEAEPIWVKPKISNFFVAAECVAEQLENWGVKAEKIKVCGIPLDESFSRRFDAGETRRKFGLDKRPIVLLMGGGMGPTRMDAVAAELLRNGKNLQIVALPGKDKNARRKLEKLKNTATVSLKILAWTNDVAALMQAADALATKPGGVTLNEAAVCGVPLVLFDAIPGPETENAKHFIEQGAGINTNGEEKTAEAILKILENPQSRFEMARNIKKLAQPEAARRIVQAVIESESEKTNQRSAKSVVGV